MIVPASREAAVIMRIWHGWTKAADADEYDRMLRSRILPGIHRIDGYRGAWLLRRAAGAEVEFVTITTWDAWDAIEQFAGKDRLSSVIDPQADRLLSRHDKTSEHYDASWIP
jgi:heme-degrading monooxygenase HmoA